MSTTLIIILIIAALLVLWGISVQNKLVQADELCNNALKQINVQQVSRYDALQALIKLTREYASYEARSLQEVSAKLIAIAEQYPDLKANQNYQQAMQDIKQYEENVRLARMTFNDTVTKFNNQVRMFPGSVVAGILGFAKRDYLAEDESKKDYPVI